MTVTEAAIADAILLGPLPDDVDDLPISYGPHHAQAAITSSIPGEPWAWVARIVGPDALWDYEREFLREVNGEYLLDPGIFEGCRRDGERQFMVCFGRGALHLIDRGEVDSLLRIGDK